MERKNNVQLLTRKLKVVGSKKVEFTPGELVILSFYTDPTSSQLIKNGLQSTTYYNVTGVELIRFTQESEGVLFFDSEIELHCHDSEFRLIIKQ